MNSEGTEAQYGRRRLARSVGNRCCRGPGVRWRSVTGQPLETGRAHGTDSRLTDGTMAGDTEWVRVGAEARADSAAIPSGAIHCV